MYNVLIFSIFIIVYLFISIQRFPFIKIDRPAGVFTGVTLLVISGYITLHEGYAYVNFDVITFLLGMLIMATYLQASGFFSLIASYIVRFCKSPKVMLMSVIFFSSILSALFVNDTICLLFTPIILLATRSMKVNPMPYLMAIAISSNLGGALTITGNPQNMLIGIAKNLDFMKFLYITFVPVFISLILTYFLIGRIYKNDIFACNFAITVDNYVQLDKPLMIKTLIALTITMVLFVLNFGYPISALVGATLTIITARVKPSIVFRKIDWSLLLFFAGLFIVMGAFEKTGIVNGIIGYFGDILTSETFRSLSIFSGITIVLSNAVSNLPAVILMLPLAVGENSELRSILLGLIASFAGNLTLVGSVANLIVAERAESEGVKFSFFEHLKVGLPITLLSSFVAICWIYMLI